MILTILIIILGIALLFTFVNREKDEEKARLAIVGLTAVIVVLTIARVVLSMKGPTAPVYDTALDEKLGGIAADTFANVAKGNTAVIVAPIGLKTPYLEGRLKGFEEQIRTHNITILGIEDAYSPELYPEGQIIPEEGLDARAFELALQKHPDAEILISLAGLPTRNMNNIARDLQRIEVYVFDDYTPPNWIDYIQHRVVDGMILQPYDAIWTDTSGTPQEVFNRRYVLVTPENLDDLRSRVDPDYGVDTW